MRGKIFFIPRGRKARIQLLSILSAGIFLLVLHFILKWEGKSEKTFAELDIEIPRNFVPVRITEREIFPSTGDGKIPKIIHQTWKSTNIPPEFTPWIKSWLALHPDWEYWLWTDESARDLIKERHPHFLEIFNGYVEPIRKADALRYFVLYEFGGIYADMDMEALTSLEPLTLKYSCFIGQEPYEHPILDTNFEKLLINALIGCRKGHPFMKMLIESLPAYSIMWHFLDSTGPHFVTSVFRRYETEHPALSGDEDFVYVTPSEYFYPTIDPAKLNYVFSICNNHNTLSELRLKACMNLKFKQLPENRLNVQKIAFTTHHWFHTYLRNILPEIVKRYQPISQVVPTVHIYNVS